LAAVSALVAFAFVVAAALQVAPWLLSRALSFPLFRCGPVRSLSVSLTFHFTQLKNSKEKNGGKS